MNFAQRGRRNESSALVSGRCGRSNERQGGCAATKAGGGKAWVRGGQWKGRAELSSGFLDAGVEEFSI